jgi:hypothetical protein
MSTYLTNGEVKDIINFAKHEATGLASICYVTGYSRDEAVDFLRQHMSSSEFLAWFYRVNELSTVKMPVGIKNVSA